MGLINLFAFGHWEERVIYCGNSYPKSVVEKYKADCARVTAVFDAWRAHFPKEFCVDSARNMFVELPEPGVGIRRMHDIDQYMASIGHPKPQVWMPRWPGDSPDAC